MSMEIAAVVNLHREGSNALPSLVSAWRSIGAARAAGRSVEMVLVLDRPDAETRELAATWVTRGARVVECDEGDLGAARNAATASTDATHLAFLDADDLWSSNWLVEAIRTAEATTSDAPQVFHPEVNIIFGDHHSLLFHRSSDDPSFRRARLRLHNMWTALSFVRREVLADFPYPRNELARGFGFEDWSWNLAILDAGGAHEVVANTCHFIRRSNSDSLLGASQSALRSLYPRTASHVDSATGTCELSALTPTDDGLPFTHRRLPHGLTDDVLEQVGFATSIEPAIAETITRRGHPRTLAVNANDHVSPAQRALESVEQLMDAISLHEAVERSDELAALPPASRRRVVAELVLGELSAGRPLPPAETGPLADVFVAYPQLRGVTPVR